MTSQLRHVGIVVSDAEVWIHFLKDVLGFEIRVDQLEEGVFISNLIGVPEAVVRTVKFYDQSGGVIEILEFQNPSPQSTTSLNPNSLGITHIALTVESAEECHRALLRNGCKPISDPAKSDDGKAIVSYVRGPENVLFEFVQELNSSEQNS